MGYSQGFGFLLLLLFSFSPYSSYPMKSWTLKSKLRNTKGGAGQDIYLANESASVSLEDRLKFPQDSGALLSPASVLWT